ncbi:MAG: FAD-binding oxidoreductase [Pseudomonadota bacterium]
MDLLTANDRRGTYPASWYAATANPAPERPALEGARRADVCIVGGGYTGLSAALHLAEAGADVVLLEAHRVGWGASGRNGGQLGSAQRVDQRTLEARLGEAQARALWHLAEDAKRLAKDLIARHRIDCDLRPGILNVVHRARYADGLRAYADHLKERYGYQHLEILDRAATRALVGSPDYHAGVLDRDAGHLHPLNYALGLAAAAERAGATLHEESRVERIDPGAIRVATSTGEVTADALILATNGYHGDLLPEVGARVMPINNFIAATEPLGERAREIIAEDIAVADSRFVVNYFRLSADGRLLFGGGETYGYRFPADIGGFVRRPMSRVFPQLRDVRIDYAWGGTLGITRSRMPHFARPRPGIWSAAGYSGHGVAMATLAGKLLAEAIGGETADFDRMAAVPTPAFPGGGTFRPPLLALAMLWYATLDRL